MPRSQVLVCVHCDMRSEEEDTDNGLDSYESSNDQWYLALWQSVHEDEDSYFEARINLLHCNKVYLSSINSNINNLMLKRFYLDILQAAQQFRNEFSSSFGKFCR